MKLQINFGQAVHVERRLNSGGSMKGISSIVGAKAPRFLFLDPPVENQRVMSIAPGEICIFRFLQEGTMVGFRTRVVRNMVDPTPMLIVEYPRDVEEIDVRHQERIYCNIPAVTLFQGASAAEPTSVKRPGKRSGDDAAKSRQENCVTLKGVIADLSAGGCGLAIPLRSWEMSVAKILGIERSGALLPVAEEIQDQKMHGTTARVEFELPPPAKKGARKVASAVRWTKRGNGQVFVGVQFMSLDEKLRQDIEATVKLQRQFFTRQVDLPR